MSSISHLYGEVYCGNLLEIKTPNNNRYYFQNFLPQQNFENNNNTYEWLPFQISNYNEQLDLNSETLDINIINTPAFREFFETEGDLRTSLIIVTTLFPDEPHAPVDIERTQISSYSLTKSLIQVSCAAPVLAFNNRIPTEVFDVVRFPQLPYFNKPGIVESGSR